jgi:hypothetical protein
MYWAMAAKNPLVGAMTPTFIGSLEVVVVDGEVVIVVLAQPPSISPLTIMAVIKMNRNFFIITP